MEWGRQHALCMTHPYMTHPGRHGAVNAVSAGRAARGRREQCDARVCVGEKNMPENGEREQSNF